ncbi:MAG: DUF4252 domain-containing protein [Cytophagales bacterium]|nr:DUF4252 domain-containing protein [Cytophagales bacterium]
MKLKFTWLVLLVLVSYSAQAQSRSYQALKDNFSHEKDVFSFSVGGWLGRLALNVAGEYEFRDAVQDVKHVRLIVIPRTAFANQNLSVSGFKALLSKDTFEPLAQVHDKGELVSIYLQENKISNRNRYLVLIEEATEIVAIEVTGYIDVAKLVVRNEIAVNP